MFEITIVVRDSQGNVKGTKSYETADSYKLWKWYERNKYINIKNVKRAKVRSKNKK